MHFRWRTNPTVIAHYMNDADVPRQAEVTLKPNEVCVVLENGKIVGSVSQTHMEVSPQVGLFGKLFGKSNPVRSFMFAFTGPHAVLVQVRGTAANGDEINCLVTLKLEVTRETAPRLITFPAKGTMTVQAKDIAEVLSPPPAPLPSSIFGAWTPRPCARFKPTRTSCTPSRSHCEQRWTNTVLRSAAGSSRGAAPLPSSNFSTSTTWSVCNSPRTLNRTSKRLNSTISSRPSNASTK